MPGSLPKLRRQMLWGPRPQNRGWGPARFTARTASLAAVQEGDADAELHGPARGRDAFGAAQFELAHAPAPAHFGPEHGPADVVRDSPRQRERGCKHGARRGAVR